MPGAKVKVEIDHTQRTFADKVVDWFIGLAVLALVGHLVMIYWRW